MQAQLGDKQPHKDQVSCNRDQSVGQVKSDEPADRAARGKARTLRPGPVFVPGEIMEHCSLNGEECRHEVMEFQTCGEGDERQQLHAHPGNAYGIKL